jgi:hypothetical protein
MSSDRQIVQAGDADGGFDVCGQRVADDSGSGGRTGGQKRSREQQTDGAKNGFHGAIPDVAFFPL